MNMKSALVRRLTTESSASTTLAAKLSATTAVFDGRAPQGVVPPYIIFSLQDGTIEDIDPNRREAIYLLIKAVVNTSMKDAEEIDALIDGLLHKQPIAFDGNRILQQVRTTRVQYQEAESTPTHYHAGGLYRFWFTDSTP